MSFVQYCVHLGPRLGSWQDPHWPPSMCVISCQGLAGCVCGCRRWRLWGCLGEVWWVPVGEAGLGGVRTSPPGPSATSARAMTARRREGKVSAWRKKIGLFQSIAKNDIFGPSWTLCIINIKSFILSLCIFFPLEVCHSFDEMRKMWSGTNEAHSKCYSSEPLLLWSVFLAALAALYLHSWWTFIFSDNWAILDTKVFIQEWKTPKKN